MDELSERKPPRSLSKKAEVFHRLQACTYSVAEIGSSPMLAMKMNNNGCRPLQQFSISVYTVRPSPKSKTSLTVPRCIASCKVNHHCLLHSVPLTPTRCAMRL
ncbi:hypothetical protein RvY_00815 [Ramazzottius varieornatus]|uniref:Uncharacterized protein n=1 Tax=Ramazzottius varieornatus TaxID=947166 RepID=A0A1D1UI33_RAMVA|nr:hypothetical protein RvY_00815 [Ramazzottius varieornatus]